ncbi:MAG: prepilin-type N-terminal cleavage/methylation domain-containing protein [Candidatus Ratteibacteria bacterium]|jgi:prepilin-type N-terminal cleavage/methylation domain-containing protein
MVTNVFWKRRAGFTLIEVLISTSIMVVVSASIIGILHTARIYYSTENQLVSNEGSASLFLTVLEKSVRQASICTVYDSSTGLNPVASGTCLYLLDRNGTPSSSSDDITHWFYLSGNEIYWQTVPGTTKRLVSNAAFLTFIQDNLYIQVFFQISGKPVLNYQTSFMLRN